MLWSWECHVCRYNNPGETDTCRHCGKYQRQRLESPCWEAFKAESSPPRPAPLGAELNEQPRPKVPAPLGPVKKRQGIKKAHIDGELAQRTPDPFKGLGVPAPLGPELNELSQPTLIQPLSTGPRTMGWGLLLTCLHCSPPGPLGLA